MLQPLNKTESSHSEAPVMGAIELFRTCRAQTPPAFGQSSDTRLFGDAAGLRLNYGIDTDYMDVAAVCDRLLVTVQNRHFPARATMLAALEGHISVHFRVAGRSTHRFGDIGQMERSDRSCILVAYPRGVLNCEIFEAGAALRAVGLAFEPDFLVEELGLEMALLPQPLRDGIERGRQTFHMDDFPFTAAMHQAVTDLLDAPFVGKLRHRHVEARALELTCLIGQALIKRSERPAELRLTPRETQRMEDLRRLLDGCFQEPPTIAALARQVGMNRTKLQYAFGLLFGATIFDYCNELRMGRALELLRSGGLSIGQVAHEVGYQHANNFTAAFKRRHGVLPSELRTR